MMGVGPFVRRVVMGLGLGIGAALLLAGCGDGGGGSGARFVPNDVKVEQVNGMSPSEAFHGKGDRRR